MCHEEMTAARGAWVLLAAVLALAIPCSLGGCGDADDPSPGVNAGLGGADAGPGGADAGPGGADDDDTVGAAWDGTFPGTPQLLASGVSSWIVLSDGQVVYRVADSEQVMAMPVAGGESSSVTTLSITEAKMTSAGEAVLLYAVDENYEPIWRLWSQAKGLVTPAIELPSISHLQVFLPAGGKRALVLLHEQVGADAQSYWLNIETLSLTKLADHNFGGLFAQIDCAAADDSVFCAESDDALGGTQVWRASDSGRKVLATFAGESGQGLSLIGDQLLLSNSAGVRVVSRIDGSAQLIASAYYAYPRQGEWIVAWSSDGKVRALKPDLTEEWVIATGATKPEESVIGDQSRLRLVAFCNPGLKVVNLSTRKETDLSSSCPQVLGMTYSDREVVFVDGYGDARITNVESLTSTSFTFSLPQYEPSVLPLGRSKLFTSWISSGHLGGGYFDGNSAPATSLASLPAPVAKITGAAVTPDREHLLLRAYNQQYPSSGDLYLLPLP